ncbi:MAG TPA: hypothetical protein VFV08_05380, partial [Puia sp.]|nr:hypothetical protein [Puia sp.]
HDEKILYHPNQTELLQFFASHIATQKQEKISSASLRGKYYTIEPSAIESVKDLLFNLISRLKKI